MIADAFTRRAALAASMAAVGARPRTASAAPTAGDAASAAVDRLAERVIGAGLSPGLSLAVMAADRLVHVRAYGTANLETGTPMSPRSVLRIGSVTKQFTAAGVLRLVEQGRLSLDDRLARFVPELPGAGSVTIRQLLTHTSGLNTYTGGNFLQDSRQDDDSGEMLARFARLKPLYLFDPGTGWAYSDTGYFLLGVVIERVSGLSLADHLRRTVAAPAGLAETAVDDASAVVPRRASGYSVEAGTASGFANASYTSMRYAGAAGSMRSTPQDLCLWHKALLGGGVLQPGSLGLMLSPVRLANGSAPRWPAGAANGLGGQPVKYGFGLFLDEVDGRPAVAHGGYIQGFLSWVGTLPKARLTLAYVVNCDQRHAELSARLDALRAEVIRSFSL